MSLCVIFSCVDARISLLRWNVPDCAFSSQCVLSHFDAHQGARQADARFLKCVTASEKAVWYDPILRDNPILTFCVQGDAGVLLGPLDSSGPGAKTNRARWSPEYATPVESIR